MDITGRLGGLVSAASIAACVLVVGCGPAGAQVEGAGPSATAPATPTPVPDGCDPSATAHILITGLVRMPDGSPPDSPGFRVNQDARLRDRALDVGAEVALASVNDAGFFLLTSRLVVSPECPKSYVIEVTRTEPGGRVLYAELDVTDLALAAAPGPDIIDADITSTPIVLEEIAQPTTTHGS
jgi:hypothetical protein